MQCMHNNYNTAKPLSIHKYLDHRPKCADAGIKDHSNKLVTKRDRNHFLVLSKCGYANIMV